MHKLYIKYFKRCIDIILSFLGIMILSPVIVITSCLIYIKLGTPILFKQQRPGYHEKIFTMYKFRTMTNACDRNGNLLPDSERMTSFGRFLRNTSIDELPELFNILKGDMSIIGPRALLVKYLPLYSEEQHTRHNVRPGLVGLAALNGRNNQSWEDKFQADIYYVNNQSFFLDLKIFIGAIKVVFSRDGVSLDGYDTTVPFTGKKGEG